jgi:hypothetical protein
MIILGIFNNSALGGIISYMMIMDLWLKIGPTSKSYKTKACSEHFATTVALHSENF